MAKVITGTTPTTEVQAINRMLQAIGEEPLPLDFDLSDPDAAGTADLRTAISTLQTSTRDILTQRWRFNSEMGFEIAPSGTLSYTDTAGKAVSLNVFVVPDNLISFDTTQTQTQQGLDLVERRSEHFTVEVEDPEDPEETIEVSPMVFYDRQAAREGLTSSDHSYLYIDPVWFMAFEDMPEAARAYVTLAAARQFIATLATSTTLAGFTAQDEAFALRTLRRTHGLMDRVTFMSDTELAHARGYRAGKYPYRIDPRMNRGRA